MVDAEQSERIRAEEILREEIRRDLQSKQPPPSQREKIWAAINSSFFLWCMSSVVVGVLSFCYQEWSTSRTEQLTRTEMVRKIDTEIASRLSFFRNQLLVGVPEIEAIKRLDMLGTADFSNGVFSEFSNRGLRSLLWDLVSIVPEREEAEIKRAIQESGRFSNVYLFADGNNDLFRKLTQSITSRGYDKALAEVFGDLDKMSGAMSPPPDTGTPKAKPNGFDGVGWAYMTEARFNQDFSGRDMHLAITLNEPDIPLGFVEVTSTLLNPSSPTVQALNLQRWGTPFSSTGLALSALQAKILQELKTKSPKHP